MNISKIRRMVKDGDISETALRYLLDCRAECEHLDYKEQVNLSIDHNGVCVSKDIVAMKNVGGGYIVIGVKDKTWEPVGIDKEVIGDNKKLRDKVRKYTGLDLQVLIIHHKIYINNSEKQICLILVRSTTKLSKLKTPSVCKISYQPNESWGIRNGDIYYRDCDETKRLDDFNLWQEIISELEYKHQECEIQQTLTEPSPFAIVSGFYRLLPKEYGSFVGRQNIREVLQNAIEKDPRIWIINLHGPGGVGKSALATWITYEYFHQKKFDAILHLSAKDIELSPGKGIQSLKPSLISLEDLINKILCLFEFNDYCSEELHDKKKLVIDLLSEYSSLIILDNMEAVNDGRIMDFVRSFPLGVKSKVLITSRKRSRTWELPIQITEFSKDEIKEFINLKINEMNLIMTLNDAEINKIASISGGLPLAIQWILGEFKRTKNLASIINRVITPDSQLLEFSFRNSWNALDDEAQQALCILSLFEDPPTKSIWRTVLNWSIENMENAISNLEEVTFVTERIDEKTGENLYHSLPITLSFAKNELPKFGELGSKARIIYKEYKTRLSLSSDEVDQSRGLFLKFQAITDTQKKAILLCRMAEGQANSLGVDEAEEYYKQALIIDPQSVYALVTYGKFKSNFFLGNEEALQLITNALKYVNKSNGFFIYYNLADVYGKLKDLENMVINLRQALRYDPENTMAEHALGVALGKQNNHRLALEIFDKIIHREMTNASGPCKSLIYAVNTKIISLTRMNHEIEIIPFIDGLIVDLKHQCKSKYILEELLSIRGKY